MNGKQSRNLRNLIASAYPDLEEVRYVLVDGHTRQLVNCLRDYYQHAKKLHHTYHGR